MFPLVGLFSYLLKWNMKRSVDLCGGQVEDLEMFVKPEIYTSRERINKQLYLSKSAVPVRSLSLSPPSSMPPSSAFPSPQAPPRRRLTRTRSSIMLISDNDQDYSSSAHTSRGKSKDRPTASSSHKSQHTNQSWSRERDYDGTRKVMFTFYCEFLAKS